MITPATTEAIRSALTDELRTRTEWDEEPALFTLHGQPDGHIHMIQVGLAGMIWQAIPHPPAAVVKLAEVAAQLPRRSDGQHMIVPRAGELIAVAFRYEAYALTSDSPHPAVQEAARRRDAGGSVPAFKDIPGRIEERCITAVGLDGGRYMAVARRLDDSSPDAAEPELHYLAFGDPGRDKLSGNVIDAVNRFLNTIKPVPVRRSPA